MFHSLAMIHYFNFDLSCKQEKIMQEKLCANHDGLAHAFARASHFLYDCRSQRSCMSTRWWLSTPVRPGRPTVLSAPSCSGILLAEFMAVHIHFNLTLFSSQILFMDFLSAMPRCTRQKSISFTPPFLKSWAGEDDPDLNSEEYFQQVISKMDKVSMHDAWSILVPYIFSFDHSTKFRCTRQGSKFVFPPLSCFRVPVTLFQLSRGTVQRCARLERVWTTTCVIPHHHCCKDLH